MSLPPLVALREAWRQEWPNAVAVWSRFTMLREPHWCLTFNEAREQQLTGSFAMIRMTDHTVVINLEQVERMGLQDYAREVMAHEVGHHVYCPADLTDEAKLMARIRAALPTKERHAGLISNLYSDLLINDRLSRYEELRMGDVYQKLSGGEESPLWTLYMRICEILWSREKGTLARGKIDRALETDAMLGARVIRVYANDWLKGAGRFAALVFSYVEDDKQIEKLKSRMRGWLDTEGVAESGFPDGLTEADADEDDVVHPSMDDAITGVNSEPERERPKVGGGASSSDGQPRKRYREPSQYADILRSVGVKLPDDEVFSRYYRERAIPHLIRFPTRMLPQTTEPLAEGLESWDAGEALDELDVVGTVMQTPQIIPGITTVKRVYGTMEGSEPKRDPLDLYVGIDCSGSMGNPRQQMSFPILAGTIVALSALRAGSRVKAVLSGEPGSYASTPDFIRDEREILKTLVTYLGTGYSFGIHRLSETFDGRKSTARPVHILIVSDHDIYAMLGEKNKKNEDGWTVARAALQKARGGGTYVLNMRPGMDDRQAKRMRDDGWNVIFISSWEDIVGFARDFSRAHFGEAR